MIILQLQDLLYIFQHLIELLNFRSMFLLMQQQQQLIIINLIQFNFKLIMILMMILIKLLLKLYLSFILIQLFKLMRHSYFFKYRKVNNIYLLLQ